MAFSAGDIVTGKKGSSRYYDVTNEYGKYRVLRVSNSDCIFVEVISHTKRSAMIGYRFSVNAKHFLLEHQNVKCEYTQSLSAMFD